MTTNYNNEANLDSTDQASLTQALQGSFSEIRKPVVRKANSLVRHIPTLVKIHYESTRNQTNQRGHTKRFHPIRPKRGEIYNVEISENVGTELNGNHLMIIMQNDKGNLFASKVNVLPIEGDGNILNPAYMVQLTNQDLQWGQLDKDPSRVILTDITTYDKARLARRIGKVKPEKLKTIGDGLKAQLGLL